MNARDVLREADQRFRSEVTGAQGALQEGAACFFSKTKGTDDINLFLRCGPALRFGETRPWTSWWFQLEDTPDGRVRVELGSTESDQSLAPDEELFRPDGKKAPRAVSIKPPREPDAPPVAEDYAAVLTEDVPVKLQPVSDGLVRTGFLELRISGVARSSRVGSGSKALTAAEEHELVFARAVVTEDLTLFGQEASGFGRRREAPPPRAVVIIDGRRRIFEAWGSLGEEPQLLVVSVPRGADQVDLEVVQAGLEQAVSMLNGAKVGAFPKTPYRDAKSGYLAADVGKEVTFSYQRTGDYFGRPQAQKMTVSFFVKRVVLSPVSYFADDPQPADAGHAWLVVEGGDYRNIKTEGCHTGEDYVEEGGASYHPPEGAAVEGRFGGDRQRFVATFSVPEDVKAGTVSLAPIIKWCENSRVKPSSQQTIAFSFEG